ncbi:MAG TPA: SHOCT domain-containing protein [Ktedonobacterales bacterium]
MMWGYPWSGAMMLWMSLWGIIWLVLLALAIWALVRWVSRRDVGQMGGGQMGSGPGSGPSAMEILRQRFARGEIDATTFEQMRERLEATRQDTPRPV